MVQKQDIITLRRREMSLRAIARELKLNRATVTKVVREFEASQHAEDPEAALDDVLATKPHGLLYLCLLLWFERQQNVQTYRDYTIESFLAGFKRSDEYLRIQEGITARS